MRRAALRIAAALCASGAVAAGAPASAESALFLPLPEAFGAIEGGTFDATGHRIGQAQMSAVKRADGRIELLARSGIEGSARTQASALLEPAQDGRALRLLTQRSESFDEKGASLGLLSIDHARRTARCDAPDGDSAEEVELPALDHVVNVPLNLLFQQLVRGETEEVAFQFLLCRFGARLVDARAEVASGAASEGLLEVRTQLDLGPLLSSVAAPFLPTLSVWFDRAHPGAWVAHRMPLFSKGPTVLVVRSGVSPARLMSDVGAGGL